MIIDVCAVRVCVFVCAYALKSGLVCEAIYIYVCVQTAWCGTFVFKQLYLLVC